MRVTGRGVASTAARLRKLESDERLVGSARDELEAGDVLSDGREREKSEQVERFEGVRSEYPNLACGSRRERSGPKPGRRSSMLFERMCETTRRDVSDRARRPRGQPDGRRELVGGRKFDQQGRVPTVVRPSHSVDLSLRPAFLCPRLLNPGFADPDLLLLMIFVCQCS